jgi:hypothetical protein
MEPLRGSADIIEHSQTPQIQDDIQVSTSNASNMFRKGEIWPPKQLIDNTITCSPMHHNTPKYVRDRAHRATAQALERGRLQRIAGMYFKCLLVAFVISYYPIVLAAALERERSTQARAERACQRRDGIKNGKDIPLPNSTSSLSSSFTVIPVLQEHTPNLQPPLQRVYSLRWLIPTILALCAPLSGLILNQLNLHWRCHRLCELALPHHLKSLVSQVIFPSSSQIDHTYIVLSSQTTKIIHEEFRTQGFLSFLSFLSDFIV